MSVAGTLRAGIRIKAGGEQWCGHQKQAGHGLMLPQVASNPVAKARFLRESRAQARVEHLNIIPIHHIGEDRGVPYLAMPLLKGQTLGAALKQNAKSPISKVLRIAREIAAGLATAHEHHLVHRDIKPANVWLEG